MKRFYLSDASETPPTAPANPSYGYPQDGNLSTRKLPTTVGAYWYHMITEEFMAVIEDAGLTPSETNLHQLADIFADFKTRATKAEGYATQAAESATAAAESAQGVITQTAEKIQEIKDAGDAQVSRVETAGSSVESDVNAGIERLQTKLQELIENLETVGGQEASAVRTTAQEILDSITATKAQVDASATQAANSASDSATSATSAKESAETATEQASVATTKATEASESASKASASASAAKASEEASKASETASAKSESAAKTSETSANDSASLAKKWATQTSAPVEGSLYGAKYYAEIATAGQVPSDWNETDTTAKGYIKNKPTLSTVAISGSYTDLTGKPALGSLAYKTSVNWSTEISGMPAFATVATSGKYSDLTGTPSETKYKTISLTSDTASGTAITIPDSGSYVVGKNKLKVSYEGLECFLNENFSEIGDAGSTSTTFKLLFDAKKGDRISVTLL